MSNTDAVPPEPARTPSRRSNAEHADLAETVRDRERLDAVQASGLLDQPREPAFDRLTRLAVRLLEVPTAFFSLVDATRDVHVAACGIGDALGPSRELTGITFCHHAIHARVPLVIPDTRADPVYREIPTVTSLGVASYIGVPVIVNGHAIGSFCVIDTVPRAWTEMQVEVLVELAASTQREIELRGAVGMARQLARTLHHQNAQLAVQAVQAKDAVAAAVVQAHALDVERARLAVVFAQAPSFLAVLRGPDLVYELVNAAYAAMIGQGRNVVGKPLFDALPELRDQGIDIAISEVRRTGEPLLLRELPVWLERTQGAPLEERIIEVTYVPLVEADGSHDAVIAHGTDVTEQVLARREIERLLAESDAARRAAELANQAKTDFLTMMSHELRTPLNAISGYVDLIDLGIRGPVTPEQRHDLSRIRRSQQVLLGLINGVLNFAKLDAGAVEFRTEAVSMRTVLSLCESLIAPQLASKGLSLELQCEAPRAIAWADAEKVEQILLNLMSNALKFTERGGRITIECDVAHADRIVTRVSDTGRGIMPAQLDRIFEPFVQIDVGLTRASHGSGLGLAISRELARGMQGELTVQSAAGIGSTFTLELPALNGVQSSSMSAA